MKKMMPLLVAGGLLGSFALAHAEQISKPHTFTAGTPALAEQVNADFDTVYGQVNKVGAAITVDGANNVGIGIATPAGELHVSKPPVMSAINFTGAPSGNNIIVDSSHYHGSGATSFLVRVADGAPPVDLFEYSIDGGQSWSQLLEMTVEGQEVAGNLLIGFAAVDGHASGDQWAWTVTGYPDGLIVSNGKVTVRRLAISGGASGQVLTSDASGNATWQTATDGYTNPDNELQILSRTGTEVTLSQGGGTVSIADDDNDPANELQAITRNGTNLTLSQGGGTVSIADNDNDPANELQTLTLVGTNLTLSQGGGTVSINDGDSVIGNEYNTSVTLSGTTLEVTDGGGVKSVDLAEKLSLGGLSDGKDDGSSLFLGNGAGLFDDGANESVALGKNALSLNYSGQWNTAVGFAALQNNSSGWGNTAIGSHAGPVNDSGSFNTFLGYDAGLSNVTGSGNVFLGYNAGRSETGSNLLYITNRNDTTPLIYGEFLTDALTINGNLHVTGNITYAGTLTDVSDERLKENIRPVDNGLAKVAALKGVYFNMKDNPGQTEVGVIAQDVQKVLPEAVSVIDKEKGYLGVSYPSLIPLLIEAVKELKADNAAKEAKIAELLQRVEALEGNK